MEILLHELLAGLEDVGTLVRAIVRLTIAAFFGALLGWERERVGRAAGLRTHMLVAIGSAAFPLASLEASMSIADTSRVLQGVISGIGFLGAGTILKRAEEKEIHGLTTAASIWLTCAAGVAVGLGRWPVAAVTVLLAWIVLRLMHRIAPPSEDGSSRASRGPLTPS